MKVSTEACLLGAIAEAASGASILDVGTGTGLLALMVAQRTDGNITSIEVDEEAVKQARDNIEASPWRQRIVLINDSIQHFAEQAESKYDLIISNPPFYTNYLPSDDIRRKLAMHTYSLSMEDLAGVVGKLLSPKGRFYVLYPAYEAGLFARTAEKHGLFPAENHIVRNKPDGPIFRMITCYGREPGRPAQKELVIRNSDEQYTPQFVELLKPYYLNL